jgi:hypothetical protein
MGVRPDPPKGSVKARDQYGNGMNLHQYAESHPVVGLDPMGLDWTLRTACAQLRGQITAWRTSGYNFAADLMQYFMDGKGPQDYTPTKANIDEVKQHGRGRILDMVFYHIWNGSASTDPPATGTYNINITHPGKGSTAPSNIRWWYVRDDKNMLNAYGGADLNVTGKVHTIRRDIVLGLFLRAAPDDWRWMGMTQVRLGDLYTFDSTSGPKTYVSAQWDESYDAALWLERNCGFKPFYHEMSFDLSWKWEGLPDAYYAEEAWRLIGD